MLKQKVATRCLSFIDITAYSAKWYNPSEANVTWLCFHFLPRLQNTNQGIKCPVVERASETVDAFLNWSELGVRARTRTRVQRKCSQNNRCEVSAKTFVLLFPGSSSKAELIENGAGEGSCWYRASNELSSSCYHDSRVSLSRCHDSPCLCARTAGFVPRQTPSCPAFFLWTGPSNILVTERRIWLHTKGNVRAVLCLWKRY